MTERKRILVIQQRSMADLAASVDAWVNELDAIVAELHEDERLDVDDGVIDQRREVEAEL